MPPPAPRRGFFRRHPIAITAVVLLVAGALAVFLLARSMVARLASDALGAPVSLGSLVWNPLSSTISVGSVALGSGDEQIAAKRLALVADVFRLARGDYAVERIELDGPTAAVRFDDQFQPTLVGFPTSAPKPDEKPAPVPAVQIGEVVIRDGDLILDYPLGKHRRVAKLHIREFVARDAKLEAGKNGAEMSMSGRFEGTVDDAPVKGEAEIRLAGDATKISSKLSIQKLTLNKEVLPLPAEIADFSTVVDAEAAVEVVQKPAKQTLDVSLGLTEPQLPGAQGSEAGARTVAFEKIHADLVKRRLDLGPIQVDAPKLVVAWTDQGLVLPIPAPSPAAAGTSDTGSTWAVTSGPIDIRKGEVRGVRGEQSVSFQVPTARWEGLRPKQPGKVEATATLESGGKVAVSGMVQAIPLDAKLDVRLEQLELAPLSQLVPGTPLRLAKGTAAGEVHVAYDTELRRLDGRIELDEVHTLPPDPARPAEVMALHSASAEMRLASLDPPTVGIASLKIDYPYVMVQRDADGTFPYSLLEPRPPATDAASAPTEEVAAEAEPKGAALRMRVQKIEIENGKVEFVDATQVPPYWTSLTDATAQVEDVRLARRTVAHFTISGKQDELSPAEFSGSITERGLEGRGSVRDVLLESMNPYVAPVLGYRITSGRLSFDATASPKPPLIDSSADVVLRGVDVLQTGTDMVQQQTGVPLPVALGLISDPAGNIRLTLPLVVDTGTRQVSLGSVVWQAVRSAIVGALTSPLRLLGSLFGKRGAPHAFAIDPVPFAEGATSLDAKGKARVAQIARILAAHQGLVAVLLPQVTPAEAGEEGPAGAVKLGDKRNAAVSAALRSEGVPDSRQMLVQWKPADGSAATGTSAVYVELQDRP